MTEETNKVVDINGKAVTPIGTSNPEVIEILERSLAEAKVGSYRAIGLVMIGDDRLLFPEYYATRGYNIHLVGACEHVKWMISHEVEDNVE